MLANKNNIFPTSKYPGLYRSRIYGGSSVFHILSSRYHPSNSNLTIWLRCLKVIIELCDCEISDSLEVKDTGGWRWIDHVIVKGSLVCVKKIITNYGVNEEIVKTNNSIVQKPSEGLGGGVVRYSNGLKDGGCLKDWVEHYEFFWKTKGREDNEKYYRDMKGWLEGRKRKIDDKW